MGSLQDLKLTLNILFWVAKLRLWAIIINPLNLFKICINAFITFIMDSKKACMEKEASKFITYENSEKRLLKIRY